MRLNEIVYQCIAEHKGGEKFFDALDEIIRSEDEILHALLSVPFHFKFFNEEVDKTNITIIVSGRFGQEAKRYIEKNKEGYVDFNLVVLEGDLRYNEISEQEQYSELIKGRYCFFVDDSYFLGRTATKVKTMVRELGGVFCQTIVAYDGSQILDCDVSSYFRYYDHFGGEKND